jgi:hypothetical protein
MNYIYIHVYIYICFRLHVNQTLTATKDCKASVSTMLVVAAPDLAWAV